MLNDELLSRLSQLNRQRLPLPPTPGPAPSDSLGIETTEAGLPELGDEDLSKLPAGSEMENSGGKHWLRDRPICEVWPHAARWLDPRMERIRRSVETDHRKHATGANKKPPTIARSQRELRALIHALPDQVIYLDLETCGFAGSMVFLVGLVYQEDGQFILSQLLARHYGEEKAMLQTLWQKTGGKRVLATFNGKSFDWPMVHDRSTIHHLGRDMRRREKPSGDETQPTHASNALGRHDPRPELIHCDLLHHARRHWKHEFENCKLQTLEKWICRRRRSQDIPGREIPAAYHDFVRSGDAWLIRSVLHHNALDLVTLLQLSVQVAEIDMAGEPDA